MTLRAGMLFDFDRVSTVAFCIALTNGTFNHVQGGKATISGAFFGPDHEEVGGVFDRDGIAGAFGAKRD